MRLVDRSFATHGLHDVTWCCVENAAPIALLAALVGSLMPQVAYACSKRSRIAMSMPLLPRWGAAARLVGCYQFEVRGGDHAVIAGSRGTWPPLARARRGRRETAIELGWAFLWFVHSNVLLTKVAARTIGGEKKGVYNWLSAREAASSRT